MPGGGVRPREQVEALARLLETQLATKADLIKWMMGVSFAQAATLIGALSALLKLFPGGHP